VHYSQSPKGAHRKPHPDPGPTTPPGPRGWRQIHELVRLGWARTPQRTSSSSSWQGKQSCWVVETESYMVIPNTSPVISSSTPFVSNMFRIVCSYCFFLFSQSSKHSHNLSYPSFKNRGSRFPPMHQAIYMLFYRRTAVCASGVDHRIISWCAISASHASQY